MKDFLRDALKIKETPSKPFHRHIWNFAYFYWCWHHYLIYLPWKLSDKLFILKKYGSSMMPLSYIISYIKSYKILYMIWYHMISYYIFIYHIIYHIIHHIIYQVIYHIIYHILYHNIRTYHLTYHISYHISHHIPYHSFRFPRGGGLDPSKSFQWLVVVRQWV